MGRFAPAVTDAPAAAADPAVDAAADAAADDEMELDDLRSDDGPEPPARSVRSR